MVFKATALFMIAAPLLFALRVDAATTSCSTVAACVMGINSSAGAGVAGTSTSGFGLSGISKSGHGVNGASASSFGVVGSTAENATGTSTARAGVLGEDLSTNKNKLNSGVAGSSTYGYGGSFTSKNGIGLFASSAVITDGGLIVNAYIPTGSGSTGDFDEGNGITVTGASEPTELYATDLYTGVGCVYTPDTRNGCGTVATIDSLGNEYLDGKIFQNSDSFYRTRRSSGADVESFGARSTMPSLEDVRKGQLRHGAAYVALDPTFASSIDSHTAYSIFITPEGDANSLYTTQISPAGFAVRESKGGRSSLTFDYRVVGRPYDSKSMRLPATSSFAKLAKFARHDLSSVR